MTVGATYALAFGLVMASQVAASSPQVAPCVHVGGNAVDNSATSKAAWKQTVYFHPVDAERVFWYTQNEHSDGTRHPSLLVVENCGADEDLVIYPPGDDRSYLSVRIVRDLLLNPQPASTEDLIDHMGDIGATWTRDAASGTCVCDAWGSGGTMQ